MTHVGGWHVPILLVRSPTPLLESAALPVDPDPFDLHVNPNFKLVSRFFVLPPFNIVL